MSRFMILAAVALVLAISQVNSAVLPVSSTELALVTDAPDSVKGEISTLEGFSASRVKRQGGCGCGCGCCCCRPKCCCCCRRCCTCCRTCCCTRCCTCCRPCCCCGCGGGGGCGCGCCGGCGGGCGCCGCGGGGRKRRSLQNLRIDHANRELGIKRRPASKNAEKC